jgi:DNA-binding transcriptional MerR regulator
MEHTVGRVAELSGVTVRTLHHYDEIGLLVPHGRTEAGYRQYDDADLERLQQVLYYRELGFPLERIAALLDAPDTDTNTHLQEQRRLINERIQRLQSMLNAVDYALEAARMNVRLTPEERFEVFGEFDPAQYGAEVEEKWGNTAAFKQARQKTSRYTKDDWKRMGAESGAISARLAAAMQAGLPASSVEAMDAAEAHRAHIEQWFYDCSYEVHRGLGDMYLADDRFGAAYEAVAPGLTQYIRDAIAANADRNAR